MYNDEQYFAFEQKFIDYIETGSLPKGFANSAQLKLFIRDNLTLNQREILRGRYVI